MCVCDVHVRESVDYLFDSTPSKMQNPQTLPSAYKPFSVICHVLGLILLECRNRVTRAKPSRPSHDVDAISLYDIVSHIRAQSLFQVAGLNFILLPPLTHCEGCLSSLICFLAAEKGVQK